MKTAQITVIRYANTLPVNARKDLEQMDPDQRERLGRILSAYNDNAGRGNAVNNSLMPGSRNHPWAKKKRYN